jgi:ATP-dependent RNA helicase DeaD
MSFETLGLPKQVLKAIVDLGFETPTPIQEQAIPSLLTESRDMVALAQTGTGKTAAFGLPLASLIDFDRRDTQALILCPTRELCMQITKDLQSFTRYCGSSNVVAIYGGASIEGQIRELRRGAQIIVGTPGRMVDMIERGVIDLSTVEFLVLDEADEMLHMGFKEDLDQILSTTPAEKSTWLFSATMPSEVSRIGRHYMKDPLEITVGQKNQGNENIDHVYYVVHQKDKYLALKRIADFFPDIFAIVFCRTKAETQQIADQLIKDGYNADALHGDLSQSQRDLVMKRYRGRALQILVATDVAARGIDVNDVTHVINYQIPEEAESYTHRSGRTARAGKTGMSIIMVNMREHYRIKEFEKRIGKPFTKAQVPTGMDVCEQQLIHLMKKLHNVDIDEKAIEPYLPVAFEELNELSKEDLIKRIVSLEFNRFLEYYRNSPDLNTGVSAKGGEQRTLRPGVVKLYMNVGQLEGFNFNSLKDFLATQAGIRSDDVTWTDVKNTFSLVEVRTETVDAIMSRVHGQNIKGRTIRIESRGNQEAGIPRTRLRSDKPGGGYKGKGGKGSYGGGHSGGRSGSTGGGQRSAPPAGEKKSGGGPKYDWNAMFGDKPMRSDKKKKKK